MKSLKKILSLFLALTIILSTLALPALAEDAEPGSGGIESTLFFDLGFEDYNSASEDVAKGLVNKEGQTTTFTEVSVAGKKDIYTETGKTTVLELATDTTAAKEIRFTDTTLNGILTNCEALTIETWVFEDTATITGRQFLFSYNSASQGILFEQCNTTHGAGANGNKHLKFGYNGTGYTGSWPGIFGEWKHLVFVREPAGDNYITTVYQNGQKIIENNQLLKRTDINTADSLFNISGATYAGNRSDLNFVGKIGSFKMYAGAMTLEEAAKKFEDEAPNYVESVSGFDMLHKIVDINIDNFDANETNQGVTNTGIDGNNAIEVVQGLTKGTVEGTETTYFQTTNATNSGIKVYSNSLNAAKEYTFETWVYHDVAAGFLFFYGYGENGNSKYHYQSNGTIQAGGTTGISLPYTLGQWRHLVFTRRIADSGNDELRVYENGELVISQATSKITPLPDHLHIGGGTYNNGYGATSKFHTFKVYDGWMDAGIVAKKFNESKDKFVPAGQIDPFVFDLDLSEYDESDKIVKNAVSGTEDYIAVDGTPALHSFKNFYGEDTRYLEFNNEAGTTTGRKITISDPNIGDTYDLTIDLWLKKHSTSASWDYFTELGPATNLFQINNYGGSADMIQVRPLGKVFASAPNLSITGANKWTHLTSVREYKDGKLYYALYVNGALNSEAEYTVTEAELAAYKAANPPLYFGASFRGCLGDVKIYRKALSVGEITAEHKASALNFADYIEPFVFDLDLSEYDGTAGTIKNAIRNSNEYISYSTFPEAKTFKSMAGDTPYIEFNSADSSVAATAKPITIKEPGIGNTKNLTIDMWIKQYNAGSTYQKLAELTQGGLTLFQINSSNPVSKCQIRPAGKYKNGTGDDVNFDVEDRWHHVTAVREYNEAEGKFYSRLYIDGTHRDSRSFEATAEYLAACESNNLTFALCTAGYRGSIGDIKIYREVLSADEIAAEHMASAPSFTDYVEPEDPETNPNIVFSLGIKNYNPALTTAEKGLVNKGSDKSAVIDNVTGFISGTTDPSSNIAGVAVPYIDTNNATGGARFFIPALNSSREFAFETWVKDETTVNESTFLFIYSTGATSGSAFHLMRELPERYSFRYAAPNNATHGVPATNINEWKHMVFTRKTENDKTIYAVYENGVKVASSTTGLAETADLSNGYLHLCGKGFGKKYYAKFATFRVYNKMLNDSEVLDAYYENLADFEAPAVSLTVTPSIESGSEIEGNSGEITLNFNTVLDDSTIETIAFLDSKGYPAERATITAIGPKSVKITYSELTYGESYRVVLSGVKSLNGKDCATAEIPYTAKSNVIIDEDFEDANVWKTTAEDAEYVLPIGGPFAYQHGTAITTDTSIIKDRFFIGVAESGNRYLRIKAHGEVTNSMGNIVLRVPLPERIEGDKAIVVEAEVRSIPGATASATMNALRIFNSGSSTTDTYSGGSVSGYGTYNHYTNHYKNPANGKLSTTPFKVTRFTPGSDSFVKTRLVGQLNKQTGRFEFYMFDGNNEANYAIIDSSITGSIATVAPVQLYASNAAHVDSAQDLGAIKITTQIVPEVTKVENYNAQTKTFDVYVNVDVIESTLIKNNIYVTQNGALIPAASVSAFDAENRKFTVTLERNIAGGEDASLNLYNVQSAAKIPFIQTATFTGATTTVDVFGGVSFTSGGAAISKLEGVTEADVTATFTLKNNSAQQIAPKVIIALYEKAASKPIKMIRNVISAMDTTIAAGAKKELSVAINGITAAENYIIKVFAWDGFIKATPFIKNGYQITY